jgi:hypothetical protein
MGKEKLHQLPASDPITGGELYISELTGEESGVTIRGKFEISKYAKLDREQAKFLETFLRCRGMLNSVEKELNISYPTVRARLDSLLETLELNPKKDDFGKQLKSAERKRKVLDQLERGEITPDEAKEKMGVGR